MKKYIGLMLVFLVFAIAGCGTQDGATTGDPTPPTTSATVGTVQLVSSSATIGTNQTAAVTVTLFDASGQLISDSTEVTFTLDNASLGSISSPVIVTGGVSNQTFTARSTEGRVTITATANGVSANQTIQISNAALAATISVAANPTQVTLQGTSVVAATVLDSQGNPLVDGTTVNFSVDNTSLGEIVSTSTTSGGAGVAQATFSAGSTTAGTAIITATSGSASGTSSIEVMTAAAGSIEFAAVTPYVVAIQGAGGQETAEVQFLVKDSNGNPVQGSETVRLELSGPNGGEYLGSVAGTKTLDVGTVAGFATVILHSGTIPGTATIIATVIGSTPLLSTSSGVIAIGGGVPSAEHFSLAVSAKNIEGGAYDGIEDTITVRIADRYGNYNVLEGTSVSFYSECAAIDRSVALDVIGQGSVIFRTQAPQPLGTVPDPLGTPAGSGSCGDYCDDENAFISEYYEKLRIDITANAKGRNPRDGLCTIIAVVDGEEEFTDANANGLYELGESYVDTYDDINLEKDDDPLDVPFGTEVAGMPYDSVDEDLIVDRDGSGTFDGMNDLWDGNKRIAKRINLLYTGVPTIVVSSDKVNVPNKGTQKISFAIHDSNFNRPIAGTSFTISITGGATLSGMTTSEFLDSNAIGTPIYSVTLSDGDPDTNNENGEVAELTFTWEWKGGTYTYSIDGTTH